MEVITRSGKHEKVSFDKITDRLTKLSYNLDEKYVDPIEIAQETIKGMYSGISTIKLDLLSADICASRIHHHPDFNKLAARIIVDNLHKTIEKDYFVLVSKLYSLDMISKEFYEFVEKHKDYLNSIIDYSRDFDFDYFGFKTLERSYLLKNKDIILECPQHMWMRVAIQIHMNSSLEELKQTYDYMSKMYFTHATPTLFNAGTKRTQMSSCYLLTCFDDITKIFKCISDIAHISKYAGGIGVSLSHIRAKGSLIRGTSGLSDGIIPLCKVLEQTARYINQGGRRQGSIACYLEPYHADIFEFVELRKNTGDENLRARDLFLALWVPDLFMKRVMNDDTWSLMCPDQCPGLVDTYGEEFEALYETYEKEGKFIKQIKARDLWKHILENQIETGMPYISYKDHANRKSNQKNIGTIKCSNLCVAPETKVLTKEGYIRISTLENKQVDVWNGFEWSTVTVRKTGTDQKLVKVTMNNHTTIECTPYHKFFIGDDKVVDAISLQKGDIISPYTYPVMDGTEEYKNPYTSGYMSYEFKKMPDQVYEEMNGSKSLPNIFFMPSEKTSLETKVRWLEGYFDAAGYHAKPKDELHFNAHSLTFLQNLRYLLHSIGIESFIQTNPEILTVDSEGISILKSYGFNPRIRIDEMPNQSYLQPLLVESVEETGRISDTYCFTEHLRHKGIFNGILTGQCNEILEVSNEDEIAVCNLASICLPKFVSGGIFDFNELSKITSIAIRNLNKVIDINFYPVKETAYSNNKNRPVGLGVQGLADAYIKMGYAFDSDEARTLNKQIFETIYYHALKTSNEIAQKEGHYTTYEGSPMSKGYLQFDMWGISPSDKWDWETLKKNIQQYGVRNSLLTALMPTASTAQIMGNSECFEPITSNLYVRKTLAGEFIVANEYLVRELLSLGLWNEDMYREILYFNGSIQKIKEIPDSVKTKYKTAYELKGIDILRQSVERGPFIDQTQSLNIFMATPSFEKLQNSHFYGWKHGLKTGMYYLRTQPAVDPIKFGLDTDVIRKIKEKYSDKSEACVWVRKGQQPPEDCLVCSS
jgi:ribonucleoside-diphosphate reductase alpha chain